MECTNCGNKIKEGQKFCPNCGKAVGETEVKPLEISPNNSVGKKNVSLVLGILSLVGVFLLIFAPVSLILSIVGLILAIIANKNVSNMAGIIINAIGLVLSLVVTAVMLFFISLIIGAFRDGRIWEAIQGTYENTVNSSERF